MIQWIISSDERRELKRTAAERDSRPGRPSCVIVSPSLYLGAQMKVILTIAMLLAIPVMADGQPLYHDCRLSEDIIHGRRVHKTVCQNQNGDWVEVHPEKKKTSPPLAPTAMKAKPVVKKPVYHDCRPSEDVVNGRTMHKTVCQNEAGDWVERRP